MVTLVASFVTILTKLPKNLRFNIINYCVHAGNYLTAAQLRIVIVLLTFIEFIRDSNQYVYPQVIEAARNINLWYLLKLTPCNPIKAFLLSPIQIGIF